MDFFGYTALAVVCGGVLCSKGLLQRPSGLHLFSSGHYFLTEERQPETPVGLVGFRCW